MVLYEHALIELANSWRFLVTLWLVDREYLVIYNGTERRQVLRPTNLRRESPLCALALLKVSTFVVAVATSTIFLFGRSDASTPSSTAFPDPSDSAPLSPNSDTGPCTQEVSLRDVWHRRSAEHS